MARRRNSKSRRRPRRKQGSSLLTLTLPYCGIIHSSGQANISFNTILPDIYGKLYESVPWRILSVLVQFSSTPIMDTPTKASSTSYSPVQTCVLQVLLNSAQTSNIEAIASFRSLCSPIPQRRVLRAKNPNVWKEDEQKGQYFLTLDNIRTDPTFNVNISFLLQVRVQFGSFTFAHKPQLWSGHIYPAPLDSPGTSEMSSYDDIVPEDM